MSNVWFVSAHTPTSKQLKETCKIGYTVYHIPSPVRGEHRFFSGSGWMVKVITHPYCLCPSATLFKFMWFKGL